MEGVGGGGGEGGEGRYQKLYFVSTTRCQIIIVLKLMVN